MRSLLFGLLLLFTLEGVAYAQQNELRAALSGVEEAPPASFFRSLNASQVAELIAIYENPEFGPGLRSRALAGLEHISTDAATSTLIEASRARRPLFVRVALRALSSRGEVGERAISVALSRPERSVRQVAIRQLIRFRSASSLETLRRHRLRERDRPLRRLIRTRLATSR